MSLYNFSLIDMTARVSSAQSSISLTIETEPGEEPTPSPGPAGGGGGGGAAAVSIPDFSVDQTVINVMIKEGESFKKSIKIKNTEKTAQNFETSISESLRDFVFVSEKEFSLNAGEEKILYLTFTSTSPDVYTGNLEIATKDRKKQVPIIFTVKSKEIIFDISLDIPAKYKEVFPGDDLFLQLTLFNLGEIGKTDVSIDYIIKDFEGNIIIEESGIVAVETQASFSTIIKLPSKIKAGDYVAIAQVKYDHSLGSASVMFYVIEEGIPFYAQKYFMIAIVIFVFFTGLILLLEYERKKLKNVVSNQSAELKKISTKITKDKVPSKDSEKIKRNLKNKIVVLDKAYSNGYISKDSYASGKKRVEILLKKLKKKYL